MTQEEKLNNIVASVTNKTQFKYVRNLTPVFDEIAKLPVNEQAELIEEIICYYPTNLSSTISDRNHQIETGVSRKCFNEARELIYDFADNH